ncbi:hypothetical protein AEAE_1048 [Aeriscardovia aeriphila]|uniref:Uncharacterized protein n=1 Tax=Aeriscardovia aeriphila TaxID=218139 RepID=A0A261F7Y0_9BIFI|nr:hypothetical protein AEAE_1048 [Aeriscardovia aeriphila]
MLPRNRCSRDPFFSTYLSCSFSFPVDCSENFLLLLSELRKHNEHFMKKTGNPFSFLFAFQHFKRVKTLFICNGASYFFFSFKRAQSNSSL